MPWEYVDVLQVTANLITYSFLICSLLCFLLISCHNVFSEWLAIIMFPAPGLKITVHGSYSD